MLAGLNILKICHPKHPQTIFVFLWGEGLQKSDIAT